MGRLQPDPSPVYFQPASDPQPQEYQYEQQGTDETPPPVYEPYNDENHHYDSTYPPPKTDQQPPPQQYPPQQQQQQQQPYPPRTYPPQPAGTQQTYPPQAEQAAVQFPPPHSESAAVQFPPPNSEAAYQASGPAVQVPPRSPFGGTQQSHQMGQNMNYASPLQPAHGVVAPNQFLNVGTEPWNTELFGCMEDPTNALLTAVFPCLTFGQIAEIVDNGHTSCGTSGMMYGLIAFLIAMPCLISCTYRTKLRSKYGLVESPAPDWLTHCLCECCALCQEYRELQHRGYEPSIGWMGNVALQQKKQQQQQMGMVPPMNQTMMG